MYAPGSFGCGGFFSQSIVVISIQSSYHESQRRGTNFEESFNAQRFMAICRLKCLELGSFGLGGYLTDEERG